MAELYYVSTKYHKISQLAMETARQITKNKERWMEYTDRKEAGAALVELCGKVRAADPSVYAGEYAGSKCRYLMTHISAG